jgi:hypothetical protein
LGWSPLTVDIKPARAPDTANLQALHLDTREKHNQKGNPHCEG